MKRRILLAEDNEVMRADFKAELERAGYEVLPASDGEVAWNFLRAGERVEMIISDYDMPRRTGLDLLNQAFARFGAEHMPLFVLMSGDIVVSHDDQRLLADVVKPYKGRFWAKPFGYNEKIREVRELLPE